MQMADNGFSASAGGGCLPVINTTSSSIWMLDFS